MSSATDLDGHPRILGEGPNMGAYEFVAKGNGTLILIL
jgi:hypothetical protein